MSHERSGLPLLTLTYFSLFQRIGIGTAKLHCRSEPIPPGLNHEGADAKRAARLRGLRGATTRDGEAKLP
jgi:hypothetical protein